jgi:hypothetical protein
MFGWRTETSGLIEAELREATLKRLAEVLDLPAEDFEPQEASKQAPSKTALATRAAPRLSTGY